jgi:energy-coupling factor transporter ATP-binding protein EcfA2
VFDLGLGAGERGGRIIHVGSFESLMTEPQSLTAKYLRSDLQIPVPVTRRKHAPLTLNVSGARQHNLRDIDVQIPLNTLTCVTGVSGSGKSTLVHDVIYAAIKRAKGEWDKPVGAHDRFEGAELVSNVTLIDQTPIGRTPRSNPVTYLKAFDPIRELFSNTKDARANALTASHFSFNVPGGRVFRVRKQFPNRVERLEVGNRIGPRRAPDGRLIYQGDVRDQLRAFEPIVGANRFVPLALGPLDRGVDHVVDQRRLPRPADPGDAGQRVQGNLDIDVPQIVLTCAGDIEGQRRMLAPRDRHWNL